MEKTDPINVEKIWKSKGKELDMPNILVAYDKNKRDYFVIEDRSTIVFMVLNKSNITFCIPKTYCMIDRVSEKEKYYKILNADKLIPVSCRTKNNYEKFVQENLLSVIP